MLPAGALVDLAEVRRESGVDEVLAALDRDLVGLDAVKARIAELAALLLVDRTRARFGIPAPRPNLHMCSPAAPGPARPRSRCGWPSCSTSSATCAAATW